MTESIRRVYHSPLSPHGALVRMERLELSMLFLTPPSQDGGYTIRLHTHKLVGISRIELDYRVLQTRAGMTTLAQSPKQVRCADLLDTYYMSYRSFLPCGIWLPYLVSSQNLQFQRLLCRAATLYGNKWSAWLDLNQRNLLSKRSRLTRLALHADKLNWRKAGYSKTNRV
jgi:hypothetical protein